MNTRALEWLSNVEPEFGVLSSDEKIEIMDFALLWSYFEAKYLNNHANMTQIRSYVDNLSDDHFEQLELNDLTSYFQDRYADEESYTYRYFHLNLNKSGNPEEVNQLLKDQIDSPSEILVGCLGIIYRFRNNLLHGEKWDYRLREQYDNFRRANNLLIELMELDT